MLLTVIFWILVGSLLLWIASFNVVLLCYVYSLVKRMLGFGAPSNTVQQEK